MATELEQAIRSAEKASREIKRLFDRLGNKEHPRGELMTAYRSARRQIASNALDLAIVLGVMGALRRDVDAIVGSVLLAAAAIGFEQARRDTGIYGLPFVTQPVTTVVEQAAVVAILDAQIAQVRALTVVGDKALIIGDQERVGVLSPGRITNEAARWITTIAVGSHMAHMLRSTSGRQDEFGRQAVAVIDERTTQTCRNVNGQVVGLNEPFRLTGGFAGSMMNPPFHPACRTTVAMVRL